MPFSTAEVQEHCSMMGDDNGYLHYILSEKITTNMIYTDTDSTGLLKEKKMFNLIKQYLKVE